MHTQRHSLRELLHAYKQNHTHKHTSTYTHTHAQAHLAQLRPRIKQHLVQGGVVVGVIHVGEAGTCVLQPIAAVYLGRGWGSQYRLDGWLWPKVREVQVTSRLRIRER